MAILKHPDLPGVVIRYPDEAVPILEASGWVDANPPAPKAVEPETPEAPKSKSKS
jgi:hypothetical protein